LIIYCVKGAPINDQKTHQYESRSHHKMTTCGYVLIMLALAFDSEPTFLMCGFKDIKNDVFLYLIRY
jgi:hypothetical protein